MGILISTLQDVKNFLQRLPSRILWGTCNQASWLVRHNLKDIAFVPSWKHSYCVPIGNCLRLPTFSHHIHLPYQWSPLKCDDLSKQVQFLWEHNAVIQVEMGPGQIRESHGKKNWSEKVSCLFAETQWERESLLERHRQYLSILSFQQ